MFVSGFAFAGDVVVGGQLMRSPTLIGLAHGSRHAVVAAGVGSLLAEVTAQTGVATRPAFLDLTAPDLDAVATELVGAGELTAVVVPLLFTDAFHARVDVPDAVARAATGSGVALTLAPILGTGDDVLDAVIARLALAGAGSDEPILLYAVGSSRPEANTAVAELADRLADRRGTGVQVGFGTCEPRAADLLASLAAEDGQPGTVVPLFVAPGLLLDALAPVVREVGWRLADPLGTLLARVVSHRYRAAIRDHPVLH